MEHLCVKLARAYQAALRTLSCEDNQTIDLERRPMHALTFLSDTYKVKPKSGKERDYQVFLLKQIANTFTLLRLLGIVGVQALQSALPSFVAEPMYMEEIPQTTADTMRQVGQYRIHIIPPFTIGERRLLEMMVECNERGGRRCQCPGCIEAAFASAI